MSELIAKVLVDGKIKASLTSDGEWRCPDQILSEYLSLKFDPHRATGLAAVAPFGMVEAIKAAELLKGEVQFTKQPTWTGDVIEPEMDDETATEQKVRKPTPKPPQVKSLSILFRKGCVRNQSGNGFHDDKTGHPCSPGGPSTPPTKPVKKPAPPPEPVEAAEESAEEAEKDASLPRNIQQAKRSARKQGIVLPDSFVDAGKEWSDSLTSS